MTEGGFLDNLQRRWGEWRQRHDEQPERLAHWAAIAW
jgi:hypothetical protein